VITEQKIKTSFIVFIFTFLLYACSNDSQAKGATWKGKLNFMHVTKDTMEMTYSVDVIGQKVFLDGYYEITRKNTDQVIFRLAVDELEFGNRDDGIPFCRIWGDVDDSNIKSYLYALDCEPI
tara:strand:+ start:1561 stop:1926 length:366 start_codon:yes stop_codon:yes gene_type:complete